MNLKLKRFSFAENGIFGRLFDEQDNVIAVTLEHSYDNVPKIPVGLFVCKRGMHRLESMTEDFETFEITNVPGHSDILFHQGNYNKDSKGCILVGSTLGPDMICESRKAFEKLMQLQSGLNLFTLQVLS
jgi:hypothetical protein